MNSKSTFVLLLVCGIFLTALVARNGDVLLLAVPFAVYLLVGVMGCPSDMDLCARRTIEKGEVPAGRPVKIEIEVENCGEGLTSLRLYDPVPREMKIVAGHTGQAVALPARETTRLAYSASGPRGEYTWDTVWATASDPCGLFEVRGDIPCFAEIQVRPMPMKLRNVAIKPRTTLHAPGPTPARLAGPGTDFWGIREYRAGDPLRRLNRRLAGRYPRRLFTNEYEGEEIADFGLIVDARRLTNAEAAEDALFESSVSAAAALSETFLKRGDRVALLVFGERPTALLPGYGKRQLNRVLRELSRAQLGRNLPSQYLEYFPARLFPSRSIIVMFSTYDKSDMDTYRRLRSFGYDVLLVSPDPVQYASRGLPQTETNRLAVRAARLERVVQLEALMKIGIAVINWQVDEPLDSMLQGVARDMAHRRNL